MKELIGKKLSIKLEGVEGVLRGVVTKVGKDRAEVLCETEKGPKVFTVVLNKVVMYSLEGTTDYKSILLLGCQNPEMPCKGVRFFVCGKDEPASSDFNVFMGQCPLRKKECTKGVIGELRQVSSSTLSEILADTVFGEYPEEKHLGKNLEESGNRS